MFANAVCKVRWICVMEVDIWIVAPATIFYNAVIKSKEIVILDNKVEIVYISGKDKGNGIVMFRSEDIVLSANKPNSSMCNNLHGKVLEMIPTKFGMEIIIDVGVKVSALITQKSVDNLKLSVNKFVWVSIKASAIRFVWVTY